jgi:hypothetical protein
MNKITSSLCLVGTVLLTAALLTGCASTYQKRSVKGSGFLKDYSHLKDQGSDTALLSYINPNAKFSTYSKIMLEPVRAYASSKDSSMATMDKEKLQMLLSYFDAVLREHLKKSYTLVNQPGPDVMRVRVALTEARGSMVLLDTASSVIPYGIAISAAKAIITGKHLSVGEVGAECEGLDSMTGTQLFAAVDARVGRKYTLKFDKFSKWHTAKDACDFWAEQLHQRLLEKSGRDPKAK